MCQDRIFRGNVEERRESFSFGDIGSLVRDQGWRDRDQELRNMDQLGRRDRDQGGDIGTRE